MKLEAHSTQRRAIGLQALIDPEVLQRCIPGCERLEKTAEDSCSTIRTGIGAIKVSSPEQFDLKTCDRLSIIELSWRARVRQGFERVGNLDLEEQGEGTLIRYTGDLQLGGTSPALASE
jgi:carbon monoxide dehydrogenase subunit G